MTSEQQFLERLPLIEKVIGYVVWRHRLSPADAEEFAAEVKLEFVADDYAVLRSFRGNSRLETYLVTVIQRIRFDLEIRKHGKWRPSAAARRLDPIAVRFEWLTCLDGRGRDEAVEILRLEQGRDVDRAELGALIDRLPRRERRERRATFGH